MSLPPILTSCKTPMARTGGGARRRGVVSFLTNEQPTLSPCFNLGTTTATTSHPQETDCGRNDSGGRSRSWSRCCSEERRRAGLEAAA